MNIGSRIKKIRRTYKLTQQVFAKKIGSTQNTITRYETNTRTPPNTVITLICREFNINEKWLRDGIGEMLSQNKEEQSDIQMLENLDDFGRIILKSYINAPQELRTYMKKCILEVANTYKNSLQETKPALPTIDERVAAYRAKLEKQEQISLTQSIQQTDRTEMHRILDEE